MIKNAHVTPGRNHSRLLYARYKNSHHDGTAAVSTPDKRVGSDTGKGRATFVVCREETLTLLDWCRRGTHRCMAFALTLQKIKNNASEWASR